MLEEELEILKREKSQTTIQLKTVSEEVPKLQNQLKDNKKLLDSSTASAQEKLANLHHLNVQLREDLISFEGEVISAVRTGQADPTSVWCSTISEILDLRAETAQLAQAHMQARGEAGVLRASLHAAHDDMLAAVDRVHNLSNLNEPHQNFVTNIMKERNYWQTCARKATRELDQQKTKNHEIHAARNSDKAVSERSELKHTVGKKGSTKKWRSVSARRQPVSPSVMYGPPYP
eukprot:CAMPEP_0196590798 /NCGR_PEP_ID=MMETSP1081-20130531/67601_1 /TAXON_ID=36882 /ORGANISM="Pyramimonas amylifera, Strain CCMP720" /LENGTH=232 /DNA_ID=CAMNT_0041913997 /DNA_START=350 /DNA_END=1048 /DNA_ORIENTATION=+